MSASQATPSPLASPSTDTDPDAADRPLNERLVAATLDLLDETGIESLTLRAIARRSGVSHGAPLRHFRSLADLLAEVAAHGFRLLDRGIAEAADQLPPGAGPLARLRAAGAAYVAMAVQHPGLFGLMFRPDTIDVTNARFGVDSSAAFERLLLHVRALQDTGWHAARDSRQLAGVVWAQVHGLATLWAHGAFTGPIPDADLDAIVALSLDLGLGPADEDPAPAQSG
jgi:AcrR family transcriptional regulator